MTHKHTPGPWYILGEDEIHDGYPTIEIAYGNCPSHEFESIAYLSPDSKNNHEEFYLSEKTKANAQLIAAAPELLEALEAMMAIVSESRGVAGYHLNGDEALWCQEFDEETNAAFEAIAKAKAKNV